MEIEDIRAFLDSNFMVVCKLLLFILLLPVHLYNLYHFWADTEKRKSAFDYVLIFIVTIFAIALPLYGIFYYWGTGFSWIRFFVYIYCILQLIWIGVLARFAFKGRYFSFIRLVYNKITSSNKNKRS